MTRAFSKEKTLGGYIVKDEEEKSIKASGFNGLNQGVPKNRPF